MRLLKNTRFYILAFSLLFSIAILVLVSSFYHSRELAVIKLTRLYAFSALGFLYAALLIGPAIRVFPFVPLKSKLIHARRAVGVSAFYFALLHSNLAFFGQLGGFGGLGYLDGRYLLAIGLSFTAEMILAAMAATSFDYMVKKLTYRWWKFLHRFVYLAGTLIVAHALLIGSHYRDLFSPVALVSFGLLAFLLAVEAIAWAKYLKLKRRTIKG